MPELNTILTLHNLLPFAAGAAAGTAGTIIVGRIIRTIQHQRKVMYRSSIEYRNRQALLRKQGQAKMAIIIQEISDPWDSPVAQHHGEQ